MATVGKFSAEMTDQSNEKYIDENIHSPTTATTQGTTMTPENISTTASSGTVTISQEPENVPTNASSSNSGNVTMPTKPTIDNRPNTSKGNNQMKMSNGKQTEDTKGTSKRTHIIIITSMICTFVGSASGLIVLYSHLNEIDAIEVNETRFHHGSYNAKPTALDKCQMDTRNAVKDCFNASDYFEERTNQKRCMYLESVGHCVMERRDIEQGQNCSELIDMLQSFQIDDSLFNVAETYLEINIRQCSFYNASAVAEITKKGHTT